MVLTKPPVVLEGHHIPLQYMMDASRTSHIKEAQATLSTILKISDLLNTGLNAEALTLCVRLCEMGVNPERLASLVKDLQNEIAEYQNQIESISGSSKNVRSDDH
ncbi:hypothetical protein D910_11657 [Dendroctonus ponderosae]|uniref:Mitotic-spindle organizing protein 1 n=1 Tax=Dendroctonus ponderosae TaxID=77166 RepID=U4UMP2_DENPD|nr:hypothetical protein D910_11657 [Dendroctonus ponderosae]